MTEAVTTPDTTERPSLPGEMPILPLRETAVFPFAVVPLAIGQARSVKLVDHVMRTDRMMTVVLQKSTTVESPPPSELNTIGTAVTILQLFRAPDGTIRLLVQGLERVEIGEYTSTDPFLVARIEPKPVEIPEEVEIEGLRRAAIDVLRATAAVGDGVPQEAVAAAETITGVGEAFSFLASTVPMEAVQRQELLEMDPLDAAYRRLIEVMQHELAVRQIGQKIAAETQQRLTKQQQEMILREQLRSIQNELGEAEETGVDELREQIAQAHLPEEAQREADRELARLAALPAASPETGMIRTYLEWLAALPWDKFSGGAIDVQHAREVLDQDHYDLDKAKDRILEHLAVKKLRQERGVGAADDERTREPVLCFVGPPGVGKTSLGQSIAHALGRKFVRVSLGGVHDEAEIRGHRRTYIGAMPGRIIQAIKRAETRDPVFMLDEIDKVSADWRGDPSSALLEVLDPAQNYSFVDNYLGVAFDLSQVLFVATANTLETIAPPLLDRMEVLPLAGYTEEEKLHIGRRYLVPRQVRANGLAAGDISFTDDALRHIIRAYTREAGVRNLEREIGSVCRKAARSISEGKEGPIEVTPALVEQYLGRPHFSDEVAERVSQPGVATGLAWTAAGGDVLFIEATMMPSDREQLILTGQLGDVMRESAQAALSYLRSEAARFGIDPGVFEHKTVHVHVPAGAVPKDGPSAGVTMLTALASMASRRPVRDDLAMTGEITLRGRVLPVGGIKEKVLAAHRAGIKTVILPARNERDLEDVPADLRQEMEFVFATTAEEVLRRALVPAQEAAGAPAG